MFVKRELGSRARQSRDEGWGGGVRLGGALAEMERAPLGGVLLVICVAAVADAGGDALGHSAVALLTVASCPPAIALGGKAQVFFAFTSLKDATTHSASRLVLQTDKHESPPKFATKTTLTHPLRQGAESAYQ